jgi:hypothetical protein
MEYTPLKEGFKTAPVSQNHNIGPLIVLRTQESGNCQNYQGLTRSLRNRFFNQALTLKIRVRAF